MDDDGVLLDVWNSLVSDEQQASIDNVLRAPTLVNSKHVVMNLANRVAKRGDHGARCLLQRVFGCWAKSVQALLRICVQDLACTSREVIDLYYQSGFQSELVISHYYRYELYRYAVHEYDHCFHVSHITLSNLLNGHWMCDVPYSISKRLVRNYLTNYIYQCGTECYKVHFVMHEKRGCYWRPDTHVAFRNAYHVAYSLRRDSVDIDRYYLMLQMYRTIETVFMTHQIVGGGSTIALLPVEVLFLIFDQYVGLVY